MFCCKHEVTAKKHKSAKETMHRSISSRLPSSPELLQWEPQKKITKRCPVEVKVERVWGKEELRDIEKSFEITSKASPNPPLDAWLGEGA